jgi:dihydrofolate reductase
MEIRMAKIVGYIATSLDGYIAAPGDKLEWLFKYNDMDAGEFSYANFIKPITTVVMGRATYDFLENDPMAWPYQGLRSIVVTSRPIPNPKGEIEIWSSGIEPLIADLRAQSDGNVWMIGGGKLQMAFLERGALDEIEIYIIPEIIGDGIPLFPTTNFSTSPRLISATTIPPGVVRLHYSFDA